MEASRYLPTTLPLTIDTKIGDFPKGIKQINNEIMFSNNTNLILYIGTREGVIYRLDPVRDNSTDCGVFVRRTFNYDSIRVQLSVPVHASGPEGIYNGKMTNHHPEVKNAYLNNTPLKSYTIDNVILLETLQRYTTIYYEDIDMVVSLTPTGWMHPRQYHKTEQETFTTDTSIRFELVDYNSYFGDSYINVNGYVHHIRAVKKPTKQEGLYIHYKNISLDGIFNDNHIEYVPLNKVKDSKWKLFTSYHEAMILGDYKYQQDKLREEVRQEREDEIQGLTLEIAKIKKETELAKAESEDAKRKYDDFKAEQEKEITAIKHQHKLEKDKLSHELEMRTMERRDTSEILKWILGIAGTLLSLVAIFSNKNK